MKTAFRTAGLVLAGLFAFQAPFPVFADGAVLDFRSLSAAAFAAEVPRTAGPAPAADTVPRAAKTPCDTLPPAPRAHCLDSLDRRARADSAAPPRALREMQAKEAARRDSVLRNRHVTEGEAPDSQPLVLGEPAEAGGDQNLRDAGVEEDEAKGWFANLFLDLTDEGPKGGGMDLDEWAAIIYVVVGIVVVGAFLIYGIQTLAELAINREGYPLFQEAGVRLSYSGHAWRDGAGADLYRDAYLAGLRYAIGFDRPGMDLGLAIEAGYLDIHLSPLDGPGEAFDFRGGYMVAGPLLRFGSFDPLCFSLEFLNGTSTHASIGWISKSRMALQARMGGHAVAGLHLGAVFYDLAFLDGLAWRQGNFNRDLSLIGGVDFGWDF